MWQDLKVFCHVDLSLPCMFIGRTMARDRTEVPTRKQITCRWNLRYWRTSFPKRSSIFWSDIKNMDFNQARKCWIWSKFSVATDNLLIEGYIVVSSSEMTSQLEFIATLSLKWKIKNYGYGVLILERYML